MKILMLVATSVATDTRVLREAETLTRDGHEVHIIGRSVPKGFVPPHPVTCSSVGTSSMFRPPGAPSLTRRVLPPYLRAARWVLLPQHRQSAFGRWAAGALEQGRTLAYDVVHAHDFTALQAGAELARERAVPLVYDTHELWCGRPREHRPTPLLDRRERSVEAELGGRAAAVITVGEGVADALRERYGWRHITVIRNTFPLLAPSERPAVPAQPTRLVYAGRLAGYRELETIAAASERIANDPGLPITLIGPSDPTWLGSFDPGAARVAAACLPHEVDAHLVAAGLVLVTHSDRWQNHRLALPNKLFHAVRAGVPVVATDVGELAAIVRRYRLGTLYRPGDADALVQAVQQAVADYPALREHVLAAAPELSWERDGARLSQVYSALAADG